MKLRTWCIRIRQLLTKTGSALNMALLLTLVCCFTTGAHAESSTQGITIRQQNASLEKIFQSIEKQTGYRFFYNESLLEGATKVSLNLQNASLQEALDACFVNQPFSYAIVEKTIIIKRKVVAVPRTATNAPMNKLIAVRGKVTSNNLPVVGATVTVKGTENATSTDGDGVFTLADVDDQGTLVVSHVSHQLREVSLKGQGFIAIELNEKINDLDEAIVVAYNTTTTKRNTGSVSIVKGDQMSSLPNRSFDKSLQGLVPGLLVTNGTGQPGGGVSNFVLRGIGTGTAGTFGSTVRHPLVVIDGIPISTENLVVSGIRENTTPVSNPLAQLNPNDIANITVLKDASAIALYGSRASNGVILVTTKKGRSNQSMINFRHQTDISSSISKKMDLLNQEEYLELLYEAYRNSDPSYWTDQRIKTDLFSKFPVNVNSLGDTTFYSAPDWTKELYKDHGTAFSNDLSFSGGNEKNTYYLNINYLKQNGIVKNTDFSRTAIHYNLESKVKSWLKIGLNSNLSYNKQHYGSINQSLDGVLGFANTISPLNPIRTGNGGYVLNYLWGTPYDPGLAPVPNPAASLDYNISRLVSYRGLGSLYGEISILPSLKFTSNVGADFMLSESKIKIDPRLADGSLQPGIGRISDQDIKRTSYIVTNTLKYEKMFLGGHGIEYMLGQEARKSVQKNLSGSGQNIRSPYFEELSSAASNITASGGISEETLVSFFSQLNYNYRQRYILSLSGRRDGSSKFGENQRYGNYWSTGVAWVLSEEDFVKEASWLNYFKIRGSIGTSGNSTVINPTTRFYLLNLANYAGIPSITQTTIPGNEDIQWEETFNTDVGIEAKFMNERLGFGLDIYKRSISNLIYPVTLPNTSGYTGNYLDNIGKMENKGIELSISIDVIRNRNFSWNFSVNWSGNKNKLIKANQNLAASGALVNKEGENFNSFHLVRWAGVNPANGKPQWIDTTGEPNSDWAAALPEIVGKPQPDGFGSVTNRFLYENFELSVFFYYQYGFQILDNTYLLTDGTFPYINQSKKALDRWQKPGDNAANPKRILGNVDGGANLSTRYMHDGDFIRLQNVSLTYNLPKSITSKLKVNNLKVYVQGNNLKLWTKSKDFDPDNIGLAGASEFAYPQQKTYSLGINLTL